MMYVYHNVFYKYSLYFYYQSTYIYYLVWLQVEPLYIHLTQLNISAIRGWLGSKNFRVCNELCVYETIRNFGKVLVGHE